MKIASAVFLLLALLVYAAKADFILKYIVETSGQRFEETIKETETNQRTDFPGYSIILSSTVNKATVLIHTSKTYMRVDNAFIRTIFDKLGVKFGTGETRDFKPTGKTETINGYETREFKGNVGGIQMNVFATDSFQIGKGVEKMMSDWTHSPVTDGFQDVLAAMEKGTGWPIRIVMETLGTTCIFESLKETNLDDREFAVPNDYGEFSLPEVFGQ
jgi:Domain of unknown function (DUF4412)